MPKRRRDQKKKNEQSSKEQSSIDSRIVDERQEKADSEKEKGTKNLTDNEKTATCKGMNKKNDFFELKLFLELLIGRVPC